MDLEHLDEVIEIFNTYCKANIQEEQRQKVISVDTALQAAEWNSETLKDIAKLAPFGEGNPEPRLLLSGLKVKSVERVGKNGGSHLKIFAKLEEKDLVVIFWGSGVDSEKIPSQISVIGTVKKDTFNGGYFFNGEHRFEEGEEGEENETENAIR